MNKSLILLDFCDKQVEIEMTEIVYPFGNYSASNFKRFMIAVHSPSQFYYTDIFATFLLSPDDAWKLFKRLLDEQQLDDCKLTQKDILESIPDHLATLEQQFKTYYIQSYKKVTQYIECTQVKSPAPETQSPVNKFK